MPHNYFPVWLWTALCLFPTYPTLPTISQNVNRLSANTINHPITLELGIVCDKEFGDLFNHDRQRILEYWTIFLADLSLRFRTLPSSNISFRVTSVTVISSAEDQPFIESVRDENGTVKLTSVTGEFAKWAYQKRDILPKFDVLMGVTATSLENQIVGVAYGNAACQIHHFIDGGKHNSAVVISDRGTWSVGAAAHELGHLLGAPHDADIKDCNQTGFIMSGMDPETQYFFSSCSDQKISEFLKSNQVNCLKHIFSSHDSVLPSNNVTSPSMVEQCRRLFQNENVFVREKESSCQEVKCAKWHKAGFVVRNHYPVDGSPCKVQNNTAGSCFWGRCLPPGFLLANMATDKCISQRNIFSTNDNPVFTQCPANSPSPLGQFFIVEDEKSRSKLLATPTLIYTSEGVEYTFKCLHTSQTDNSTAVTVSFANCSKNLKSIFKWKSIDDNYGQLILSFGLSTINYCIGLDTKSAGIIGYKDCDMNDTRMLWKRINVLSPWKDETVILETPISYSLKEWIGSYWQYFIAAWVLFAMILIGVALINCWCHDRNAKRMNISSTKSRDDEKDGYELARLTASQRVAAELLID